MQLLSMLLEYILTSVHNLKQTKKATSITEWLLIVYRVDTFLAEKFKVY